MLNNKKIVLGITGGIAAYKALELARLFIKNKAEVWPVMTRAAVSFITPLSLQTVARNTVSQDMFALSQESKISHIDMAEKADLVVVAPATANVIGKVASGIADDLLTTIIMATKAPVLFAPAMNSNMYDNKIVQHNIERLRKIGYCFIGPAEGELACGNEGKGRLAPLEDIIDAAEECLAPKDLKGQKVLVTAGPTREAIDPVRFISNPSSGKMGYAIARAARRRGAEVVLVSGPSYLAPPRGITFIKTITAEEMAEATMRHYPQSTVVIMAAAVSDYRPKISHRKKVKKEEERLDIELERTQDILKELGNKKRGQFLVGFALETEDMLTNAKKKLKEKKLDLIVANSPSSFDGEVTQVSVIDKDGKVEELPSLAKNEAAERILDKVVRAIGS
ncbi:MAG: phosphopantothenoylcysteine decarboxylase [Deltaproteobacteria bacterium RIFCSPLOWO2_12_FULL_43_16]|nr:MAG: phosphopantothenoylcysteine decarboxylase [Deltaproteobacteria bacterium RIFCSPHIGHO2_02_FULL_43_33]OGQ61503.1 MAG: phosphopantothenoylcysteine decarboxylase [Deltaproteobacteria bacterium RIFCSPLOWO2_12_FULL_43_16]HBR17971.1 bifunctional phosphopantothenoylcysteine decarboxylase/phosphopantothenate--cysteine ligase CoaBC [Deltaproteobacteria bacterium]